MTSPSRSSEKWCIAGISVSQAAVSLKRRRTSYDENVVYKGLYSSPPFTHHGILYSTREQNENNYSADDPSGEQSVEERVSLKFFITF